MDRFDAKWLLGLQQSPDGITISVGFELDPMYHPESRTFKLNMSKGNLTYRTIIHADREGLDTEQKAKEHLNGWVTHFRNLINAR